MSYPIYIGTMKIVGEVDAFDYEENKDVFENKSDNFTDDHIWPKSRNGSNTQDNKQTLTDFSNFEKADNVSGYVGDVRFTILHHGMDENDRIVGTMYVSYDQGAGWYEVNNN